MRLKINPTRIELIRLRKRLKIVQQGWKLLKKKRDGLMREFLKVMKEIKKERERIEKELIFAFKYFIFVRASLRNKEIEEIFSVSQKRIFLEIKKKNIMGVETPIFELYKEGDFLNYSPISTPVNLDLGMAKISSLLEDLIKLAELQKTASFLAEELEKTRRRVNALEYVHLPQLKKAIKYISSKLEERERFENIVLMKTKEFILES